MCLLAHFAQRKGTKLFSGTLLVRGQGLAHVTATGVATELGRIGSALGHIEREPPRLRAE